MSDLISREDVRELLLCYRPAENGDISGLSTVEQACMFMLDDILYELEEIESENCPNCGYRLNGSDS